MPLDARQNAGGHEPPRIKLVAGNSNHPLADAISSNLKVPLARSVVRRFADMEVLVEIQEKMRGEEV